LGRVEGWTRSRGTCVPPAGDYVISLFVPKKNNSGRLCSLLGRTCQSECYDVLFMYLVSMNLADSESNNRVSHFTSHPPGSPFLSPGERQKLITFPITAEKSHVIDLQFTAVRRQRWLVRKGKTMQSAVAARVSTPATVVSYSKIRVEELIREKTRGRTWAEEGTEKSDNDRRQTAAIARAGLELPKLTACVPFFPEFEHMCVSLNGEFTRTPRRCVGGGPPLVPSRSVHLSSSRSCSFIQFFFSFFPCVVVRACNRSVTLASLLYPDLLLVMGPRGGGLTPSPQRSLVISLRNSDMVPILRKAQFKGPCGSVLLERSQILPIDSGESPPFSFDESPQFHAPSDKVQSCFAVKETAFQFGARTFR
jgi:hypothetical protein